MSEIEAPLTPARPKRSPFSPSAVFALILAVELLCGLALPWVSVPIRYLPMLNMLIGVLFMALPIYAIFRGAEMEWTAGRAVCLFALGAITHVAVALYAPHVGIAALFCASLANCAIIAWCLGFGAIVSLLIKDKNLLLPVAIALAFVDIFLVLTPIGPTANFVKRHPKEFAKVGYQVPSVKAPPKRGPRTAQVAPQVIVGPADFAFLSMFLVAIYRYKMDAKTNLLVIGPALIGYMLLVAIFGRYRMGPVSLGALPAMVPIGLSMILVNVRQFTMNRSEKMMTACVAVGGLALVCWGATRPIPPPEPADGTWHGALPPPSRQIPDWQP